MLRNLPVVLGCGSRQRVASRPASGRKLLQIRDPARQVPAAARNRAHRDSPPACRGAAGRTAAAAGSRRHSRSVAPASRVPRRPLHQCLDAPHARQLIGGQQQHGEPGQGSRRRRCTPAHGPRRRASQAPSRRAGQRAAKPEAMAAQPATRRYQRGHRRHVPGQQHGQAPEHAAQSAPLISRCAPHRSGGKRAQGSRPASSASAGNSGRM